MSLLLTPKQKEELNKSLLGYFESLGYTAVVEAFKKDAAVGSDVKFKDMLEKKWRSILRLEGQVEDLTRKCQDLEDKIDDGRGARVDLTDVLPDPDREAGAVMTGHRGSIVSLCFHPRFNLVVTASQDNTLKVWKTDGQFERTLIGHTDAVQWCQFNRDGSLLASCSADTTVKLWDFGKDNDGSFGAIKTLSGHDNTVSCCTFDQAGEVLFTCSRDKTIKLWEVETGHCKKTLTHHMDKGGHTDWIRVVQVSPDQTMLASCGMDQTICVWDLRTGACLTTLRDHDHAIETIAWSNALADKNIIDYILDEDDQKTARGYFKQLESDGKQERGGMFLCSGSRDRTMRLWLVQDGVCVKTMRGHDNWIRDVLFHPSGKYILSCSDDRTVRVWDLVKYGKCKFKVEAHASFVSCLAWNNHHPMMATGSQDNSVKVWSCVPR